MPPEDNRATINLLKLGRVVPEKCMQTDRHAGRHACHNRSIFFRILYTKTPVFYGVINRLTFSLDTV